MNGNGATPTTAAGSKNVRMTADQILAGFLMLIGGQVSVVIQHVPPPVLAQQLMEIAAKLLAGLEPIQAREAIAKRLAEGFCLSVETNAVTMRTTRGGIVVPPGVPVPPTGGKR